MLDTITRKPITLQDLQHDIAALEYQLERLADVWVGNALYYDHIEREIERRREILARENQS